MNTGIRRAYEDQRWNIKGNEKQILTKQYLDDIDKALQELRDMQEFLTEQYKAAKDAPRNAVPGDYDLGHVSLLYKVNPGCCPINIYKNKYEKFIEDNGSNIWVIERDSKIVASGTLFIEPKLVNGCGHLGHIQDFVVHKDYRGDGLHKLLLEKLVEEAKRQKCYKVVLACPDEDVSSYEPVTGSRLKLEKEVMMAIYINP